MTPKQHLEHSPGAVRGYCGAIIRGCYLYSVHDFFVGKCLAMYRCKRCEANYEAAQKRKVSK